MIFLKLSSYAYISISNFVIQGLTEIIVIEGLKEIIVKQGFRQIIVKQSFKQVNRSIKYILSICLSLVLEGKRVSWAGWTIYNSLWPFAVNHSLILLRLCHIPYGFDRIYHSIGSSCSTGHSNLRSSCASLLLERGRGMYAISPSIGSDAGPAQKQLFILVL